MKPFASLLLVGGVSSLTLVGCHSDDVAMAPAYEPESSAEWTYGGDRDWEAVSTGPVTDAILEDVYGRFHGLPQDLAVWPAVLETEDPAGYAVTDEPDTVATVE